jgi:cobyrinic acid a,c-diamide synthase
MGSLSRKGLRVQGFKVGPDFIDPSYHTAVTDRKSRNLDAWMLSRRRILDLFHQNTIDCDIAIVEGVMGLYDGLSGTDARGSTAELAKLLRSPVILVVDVWGMARSAAAVVEGCKALDRGVNIAGVILNRVAGEKHAEMCRDAIESITSVPVLGALPKNPDAALPERHLGLVPTVGRADLARTLTKVSEFVKANVDLERVVEVSKTAPSLTPAPSGTKERSKRVRVGIAYDESFNFYYQDALDTLTKMGVELVQFSPVHDKRLPERIDGLYLGGGFPEVLSKELEDNRGMRSSVKMMAEGGLPIYAECGGLMYLTRSITNFDGRRRSMAGVLDCETVMTKLTLNYTDAVVVRDNMIAKAGSSIKGHEFHFSRLEGVPKDARFAYRMERGSGIKSGKDGWMEYSVLAQYMHTHLAASPRYASNLVETCLQYRRR